MPDRIAYVVVAMAAVIDKLKAALEGHYSIERELGEGGMALVFLAHDDKLDREVAIKVMKPDLTASVGAERFLREIRIAAKLNHPHILPVFDSGDADGLLYYVMPFIQGESLSDLLAREQQLSIEDAVRITCEVAEALAEAHSQDIIHRDIKPQNIMMSGGHAIVADFGIARAVSSAGAESLTQTGTSVGTPAYMSPEQSAGDPNVDGRADIYSLGCVLYELLVGQIPFTGATPQQIMARHSIDMVPPPHIMRQSIPDELEDVIMCALAKVPADRFRTAQQFAEALTAIASGQVPHVRTTGIQRRHTQRKRRSAMLWPATIGAVVVVVGGAIGWQAMRGNSSPAPTGDGLDPSRIAVLYFEDLSSDGDLGYIADGLTEGLIDELSDVRGLSIISRNGVAPFRDENIARDSIARALGVGSLIVGSVEQSRDRLRVTARLVDGNSAADFARASFELPSDQLLAAKDSIVQEVSRLLRERLGEEIRIRARKASTTSVRAWSLVQLGEKAKKDATELVSRNDSDGAVIKYAEADSLLALAEQEDPNWTEPIVLRGWISSGQAELVRGPAGQHHVDEGLEHAARALDLAPNDAPALELRGSLRYLSWGQRFSTDPAEQQQLLADARADLEQAIEQDPTITRARVALTFLYYQTDDTPAALLMAQRALEEDAYLTRAADVLDRLFWGSIDLEQFRQARRWCGDGARRFQRDYRFVACQMWVMVTPAVEADVAKAWRLLAALDTVTPEIGRPYMAALGRLLVGGTLARAGLEDSSRAVLLEGRGMATFEVDPSQGLLAREAYMRTLLGDYDEAIDLLKRAVAAEPGHGFEHQAGDWWWRELRDHPRFSELTGSGG